MIKQVKILDYQHLAYCQMFGGMPELSHTVEMNGVPTRVRTTLTSGGTKWVVSQSEFGSIPFAVCFDGGAIRRKEKFRAIGVDYKANRKGLPKFAYEDVDRMREAMRLGGVSTYGLIGHEADDFIISLVYAIREDDKLTGDTTVITIYTNDGDLLPLVDENTIVYKRSNVTWARTRQEELKNYRQFTPESFEDQLSSLTDYKGFDVPYNAVFLYKLIRGDKADNIPAISVPFGASAFNKLVEAMRNMDVDFGNAFRYTSKKEDVLKITLEAARLADFKDKVIDALETQIEAVWDGYQPELLPVDLPQSFSLDRLQCAVGIYAIRLPQPKNS